MTSLFTLLIIIFSLYINKSMNYINYPYLSLSEQVFQSNSSPFSSLPLSSFNVNKIQLRIKEIKNLYSNPSFFSNISSKSFLISFAIFLNISVPNKEELIIKVMNGNIKENRTYYFMNIEEKQKINSELINNTLLNKMKSFSLISTDDNKYYYTKTYNGRLKYKQLYSQTVHSKRCSNSKEFLHILSLIYIYTLINKICNFINNFYNIFSNEGILRLSCEYQIKDSSRIWIE